MRICPKEINSAHEGKLLLHARKLPKGVQEAISCIHEKVTK